MIGVMVEKTYDVPAQLVMNETACDEFFEKGSCPKLLFGIAGVIDAESRLDGDKINNDIEATLETVLSSGATPDEVAAAIEQGEFNGTKLPSYVTDLGQALLNVTLPDVNVINMLANSNDLLYSKAGSDPSGASGTPVVEASLTSPAQAKV